MDIKEKKHSETEDSGDVLYKILIDRGYTQDERQDFFRIISDKSTEVINYMLELMVDDILESTDEEIINEALKDGIDIKKEVEKIKRIFNNCKNKIR